MKTLQITLHPVELEKLLKNISNKVSDTIVILNQLQNKLSGGVTNENCY